jgi:hypothetical protein
MTPVGGTERLAVLNLHSDLEVVLRSALEYRDEIRGGDHHHWR